MNAAISAMVALAGTGAAVSATAETIVRVGKPGSSISSLVVVPQNARTAYVSGTLAGMPGTPITGNTEQQTSVILGDIKSALEAQGMSMADVVMLRVYLVPDKNNGDKIDRDGMTAAYKKHFGTTEQPNKPARVTIEVPDITTGALVEIEAQAAHIP